MKAVSRNVRYVCSCLKSEFSDIRFGWIIAALVAGTALFGLALHKRAHDRVLQQSLLVVPGTVIGDSVYVGSLRLVKSQKVAPMLEEVQPGQVVAFGVHPPAGQTWWVDTAIRTPDNKQDINGPFTLVGGGGNEDAILSVYIPTKSKQRDYATVAIQRYDALADGGKGGCVGHKSAYIFPVMPRR